MPGFNVNSATGMFTLLDITLYLINFGCFGLFVFSTLVVLYNPHGGIFLGGFVEPQNYSVLINIPVIIFHTHMFAVLCSNIAAIGGPIVMYACYLYFMVSLEIRLGRTRYIANNEFRTAENLRLTYRSLQILNQQALVNCPLGAYIVVLHAIFTAAAIYIIFVLIRYWDELQLITKAPLVIGVFLVVSYWTLILQIGCMFYVGGTKTLNSWKRHNWDSKQENRVMSRFRQSCQPILLSYGNQFVIGRKSVLSYCKGVERGTFRGRLATK